MTRRRIFVLLSCVLVCGLVVTICASAYQRHALQERIDRLDFPDDGVSGNRARSDFIHVDLFGDWEDETQWATPGAAVLCTKFTECPVISDIHLKAVRRWCGRIVGLHLGGSTLSDGDLRYFSSLRELLDLRIENCKLSSDGLLAICRFGRLRRLDLSGTPIKSVELGMILKSCPDLRVLEVRGCKQLDDEAMHALSFCSKLRHLDLTGTAVTEQAFAAIECLPELEVLFAEGTGIAESSAIRTRDKHAQFTVIVDGRGRWEWDLRDARRRLEKANQGAARSVRIAE